METILIILGVFAVFGAIVDIISYMYFWGEVYFFPLLK